jgi:hypothetical protein
MSIPSEKLLSEIGAEELGDVTLFIGWEKGHRAREPRSVLMWLHGCPDGTVVGNSVDLNVEEATPTDVVEVWQKVLARDVRAQRESLGDRW